MVGIGTLAIRDNMVLYFTSKDNGQTFSRESQKIEPGYWHLYDFQVSNGHWVSMTYNYNWYSTLLYGYLNITTSDGTTKN
jgi:hypothetical protein